MDLGIGYITLFRERLSQVDFLSWMGQLEFVMVSARPKAVQSYTTLVRPLDLYSWCFMAGSSLMMVTMLYCIYWTVSLKKSLHRGWSPVVQSLSESAICLNQSPNEIRYRAISSFQHG